MFSYKNIDILHVFEKNQSCSLTNHEQTTSYFEYQYNDQGNYCTSIKDIHVQTNQTITINYVNYSCK